MRVHSGPGLAAVLCLASCGGAQPATPPTDSRGPSRAAVDPRPVVVASAEALVQTAEGVQPSGIDEDGRLFVAYASLKHVARRLQAREETASTGDAVETAGVTILACGLVAAFFGEPSVSCLENADMLPVPDDVAAMTGQGEGADLGDVAAPLFAWNEERLEEKRAQLAAASPPCRLQRVSSFGESGLSRAEIARFLSISTTASAWFRGVSAFHFATLRCGEQPLQLLMTEYTPGQVSSMSSGSTAPLRVLSWQVADEADADALHAIFTRP